MATASQLFSLGIPCVYYGSEQASQVLRTVSFPSSWRGMERRRQGGDRFLREAMFGPSHPRATHDGDLQTQIDQQDASLPGFGAFGTSGAHAFDAASPAYRRIAALCRARAAQPALRIGRGNTSGPCACSGISCSRPPASSSRGRACWIRPRRSFSSTRMAARAVAAT